MRSVGYSPMLTFDSGAHQEVKASRGVRALSSTGFTPSRSRVTVSAAKDLELRLPAWTGIGVAPSSNRVFLTRMEKMGSREGGILDHRQVDEGRQSPSVWIRSCARSLSKLQGRDVAFSIRRSFAGLGEFERGSFCLRRTQCCGRRRPEKTTYRPGCNLVELRDHRDREGLICFFPALLRPGWGHVPRLCDTTGQQEHSFARRRRRLHSGIPIPPERRGCRVRLPV